MLNRLVVVVGDQVKITEVLLGVLQQRGVLGVNGFSDLFLICFKLFLRGRYFLPVDGGKNSGFGLVLFLALFRRLLGGLLLLLEVGEVSDILVKGLLSDVKPSYLLRNGLLEVQTVPHFILNFVLNDTQDILHIHDCVIEAQRDTHGRVGLRKVLQNGVFKLFLLGF